ncbi:response regulator [Thermostichus vulcanus]|uniref:response regulator n=1 Tax=Thermostichus vulcanus TaxID=32053 RepID=UPI001FCBDF0B
MKEQWWGIRPVQSADSQGTILLVDDTLENLDVLDELLSEQGYEVRRAINGSMALRAVEADPPDLILLDIMMPEMDGYQVCEQIKKNEATWDIPIIFISALSDVFDKVKAFQVGGVDYLSKPFQAEEVLARVKTHLNNAYLQKELQMQKERWQQRDEEEQQRSVSLKLQRDLERKRAEQYLERIMVLEDRLRELGLDPEQP